MPTKHQVPMANILFASLLLAISAAWSALGQDAPGRGADMLERFFKRYPQADANGDGQLSMEEARAYRDQMKSGGKANAKDAAPETKTKTKQYDREAGTPPDIEEISFGDHERLKLDLWKAKSDKPTPILVFFHGGGGDKLMWRGNRLLEVCLKNGISVAAVNYRPNNQFPFPVPMQDAARAIQFLRFRATEYNLDPARVAGTGTSLGANATTWMAYHDDIADPNSDDPVLRQSSRLLFVIAGAGQTFNDMALFQRRVYPYALRGMPAPGKEPWGTENSREISAIYHVTRDDPPIFMNYGIELKPLPLAEDTPVGELIHNPAFGLLLKEKLDELGIENEFYHGGAKAPEGAQEKFALKHFFPDRATPN